MSTMTDGAMDAPCVHAGVLVKYVNMAKGWRDRLFVLANNKLVYYKVLATSQLIWSLLRTFSSCHDVCLCSLARALQLSGKRAVNVQSVLDHYDPTGSSIRLVGAKIFLLLKEKRKCVQCSVFACLGWFPVSLFFSGRTLCVYPRVS